MLNLSSYYGVPVIVSARTMVDQGGGTQKALTRNEICGLLSFLLSFLLPLGGTQKAFTRNDICGLLSLKKEKEEEEKEEEESGFFFKI